MAIGDYPVKDGTGATIEDGGVNKEPAGETVTLVSTTIAPAATETKITAAAMPAGGVGFIGWLSAIWYALIERKATGFYRKLSATADTNPASVKASAGSLCSFDGYNSAAYDIFIKFYNKASAPTVGTDTPVYTYIWRTGSKISEKFPNPLFFSTGIAIAVTKLIADADTTVLVANDFSALNIHYA